MPNNVLCIFNAGRKRNLKYQIQIKFKTRKNNNINNIHTIIFIVVVDVTPVLTYHCIKLYYTHTYTVE